MATTPKQIDFVTLARKIKRWAQELGFQQLRISDTDLLEHEEHLLDWLRQGRHGEMEYMTRHGTKRSRPEELLPGTIRIISVRMNYLSPYGRDPEEVLQCADLAYISRYALGRDYHKLMRNRLQRLARRIQQITGPFGYRAFADSAPVLEKAIAAKSGIGWIGKHTNLLNRDAGSWFFLGELYTDLPLPTDPPVKNHCGRCQSCLQACPTQAITAPYQLDARRCISYLTIELRGSIPVELRPYMGNRIFGCDDCQLVCPWNRYAKVTELSDFRVRHRLDTASLIDLFAWDKDEFFNKTEGSAIRRIGHEGWLRNLAVALGNAATTPEALNALRHRANHSSELVREHVCWALTQHERGKLRH
jgi:epoxyqueuosine reductase